MLDKNSFSGNRFERLLISVLFLCVTAIPEIAIPEISAYVRCLVDWLLGSHDPRTRGGHDSFLRISCLYIARHVLSFIIYYSLDCPVT